MKKFILEVFILIALVTATGFVLYKVGPNSDLVTKVKNINDPLAIINLGTSHGSDFDYKACKKHGAGINKEGNTLYYDLQNLIYLDEKGKLSDSAVIIIPVSYFVFGLGENREDRLPDNSFVNDYYYYLPKEQIYNYSYRKKLRLVLFKIQKSIKSILRRKGTQHNTIEKSKNQLKKQALQTAEHHKRISRFRSQRKNIAYLNGIITYSKSKGYRSILVSTPYYHYYNEFMGEDWLNDNYFKVMDSLSKNHQIDFLDYSRDERFTYNTTLFLDADHLNEKGRALFSRIVFDAIYESNTPTHDTLINKGRQAVKY